MSIHLPLSLAAATYGATCDSMTQNDNGLAHYGLYAVRFIYGLGCTTLVPAAGVCYHLFYAAQKRSWSHLQAAGVDLAVVTVSTTLLFVAYKIALTMPDLINRLSAFKNAEVSMGNMFAYFPLFGEHSIKSAGLALPFVVPVFYSAYHTKFK